MEKHLIVSWIRIFFALLVFTAIVVQLSNTLQMGKSAINFFSFFTIESNVLAASVLLILGCARLITPNKKLSTTLEFIRGGATLYMTMTGIIYIVLLSGYQQELQTTIPWVNAVLHYVMPVVMLIDWLIHPPAKAISYKKALWWLLYPVAYLLYSLIRGPIVGWYPYPFINPALNGWSHVIMMCFIISLGVLLVIRILIIKPRR